MTRLAWATAAAISMLCDGAWAAEPAKCFHAADQSRGWKKVSVAPPASKLAPASSVPQLTLGNVIETFSKDSPKVFVNNGSMEFGKQLFRFSLSEGSYRIKLQFAEGMKGAKVDVIARTANGTTHPLWDERRTRDALLDIQWDVARVSSLDVIVHHHLRTQSNLTHWTVSRRIKLGENPGLLPEFQEQHALYYFNEGGKDIVLCEQTVAPEAFDDSFLEGAKPVAVTLVPLAR